MKTFVRNGLTLLALAACGQTPGLAFEVESKPIQEQRLNEVDNYLKSFQKISKEKITTLLT